MSPQDLNRLRGRIGAYRQQATHDMTEMTARAREAFLGRFEREVDPDRALDPGERQRRATAARKAYFARLAYSSATKRSNRASTHGALSPDNRGDER